MGWSTDPQVDLVACGACGRGLLVGTVDEVSDGGVSVRFSRFIESPGRTCVH